MQYIKERCKEDDEEKNTVVRVEKQEGYDDTIEVVTTGLGVGFSPIISHSTPSLACTRPITTLNCLFLSFSFLPVASGLWQ